MKKDLFIMDMLIENGATDIGYYLLVNNYGYTFFHNGTKYDLRHWLNAYGSSCDFWDIMLLGKDYKDKTLEEQCFMKEIKDKANEINDL